MRVMDLMSRYVESINPEDNVQEAIKMMDALKIGSLMVVEDNELLGVITTFDIIGKVIAKNMKYKDVKVKEIMTSSPLTASMDQDIKEVSRLMFEKKFWRLPVTENGMVIGIISASDILGI